jgi:HrpA-like RNA helicase
MPIVASPYCIPYQRGGSKPALDDRLMAVCVKVLSTVMRRGEAALVFVAGFADIEDLHALFAELPAHCAVEAFPFHSLISPEEQVRPCACASCVG